MKNYQDKPKAELVDIIFDHEKAMRDLSFRVALLQMQNDELNEKLADISTSKAWRLVKLFWSGVSVLKTILLNIKIKMASVFRRPKVKTSPWKMDENEEDESNKTVQILTTTFFNLDGTNMFFGGAERYVLELVELVNELGYEAVVYQAGNQYWTRYYKNVKVIGLDVSGNINNLSDVFYRTVKTGKLIIYSPFELATKKLSTPSIGISHGISWDRSAHNLFIDFFRIPFRNLRLIKAFSNLTRVVSVDTNTINWVRTVAYNLTKNFKYIPNFVDQEQFFPNPASSKDEKNLVVLYPRRLYAARGFYLVVEVLPEIISKYDHVNFLFIGKADPKEEAIIQKLISIYPERITWYFLPPEQMHQAYQAADIAIIPTIYSEGTSLSCLEALASGNAVIASNVGGLPDLILSGFNGLLIEANSTALQAAIEQLVEDNVLREQVAKRGVDVATTFNIQRWREQWRLLLRQFLAAESRLGGKEGGRSVVFPRSPGIDWGFMQQRPHHFALLFAQFGFETYWFNNLRIEESPGDRLHIIDARDELYLDKPVIMIYYPFSYPEIAKYHDPYVIYDYLDDISIHGNSLDTEGRNAEYYHQKLLKEADLVTVSSSNLHADVAKLRPDALYIPNGVDLHHFDPEIVIPTNRLADIGKPIIGYHGAIAEWFDFELLSEVARERTNWNFVLIGPISDDIKDSDLFGLPNVTCLGYVPYEEIPRYIACFDVGILPFKVNTVTENIRPLKVIEYLAMRKPVVTTRLVEIENWLGITQAGSPYEFIAGIESALRESHVNTSQMDRFLEDASWDHSFQKLKESMQKEFGL